MKILVVGSGGREDAICWKLSKSPKCEKLYCAPGNAGTTRWAVSVPHSKPQELLEFAKKEGIGLTFVGPEVPLVEGIVDLFEKEGLKIFGPSQKAAMIEGSKAFSKHLMKKYAIPTAAYEEFTDAQDSLAYVRRQKFPLVIKADGLAAGKGVIICTTLTEAESAVNDILVTKKFGDAGTKIIVEEFLQGEEASILCFTDGKTIVPMESSQDHKRIFDGDKGPNTGGMGAYSPAPVVTADLLSKVQKDILEPSVFALENEGALFKGVLYVGLMVTKEGPKVLEYNCRFGDPETQAVLPRLKTDLVDICLAVIEGRLSKIKIEWDKRPSVCVVVASGGYPDKFAKGYTVEGLDKAEQLHDVIVFHAGTADAQCNVVTSGGRVLGVTGLGDNIGDAINKAYKAVSMISFKDMHYRKDIGAKALNR